jgi:hypothetical protein
VQHRQRPASYLQLSGAEGHDFRTDVEAWLESALR